MGLKGCCVTTSSVILGSYLMLMGLIYCICKNETEDNNSKYPSSAYYVPGRCKIFHPFQLIIITAPCGKMRDW